MTYDRYWFIWSGTGRKLHRLAPDADFNGLSWSSIFGSVFILLHMIFCVPWHFDLVITVTECVS